ncbi:MAG: single-stranded DNA-binding protein [Bacilli bacterium]|nr:single-stranded DNA-binding protein [Bacilli bacterium]
MIILIILRYFQGGEIILNQIVLVGRLTRDVKVNKSENGVNVSTITLAIPRSFKNIDGNYDTDFIDCLVFDQVALNTKEYCKKGDIVGIKGRIQSRLIEEDDHKKNVMEIITEKVTFLSSKSEKEDDE